MSNSVKTVDGLNSLDINGDIDINGNIDIDGNADINGNVDIGGSANITGNITSGSIISDTNISSKTIYVNNTSPSPNGYGRLQITGNQSDSMNSPSILLCFNNENYPVVNLLCNSYNLIDLTFASYRTITGFRSSSVNSNFMLRKGSTSFSLFYDSGKTPGTNLSPKTGWEINTSGQFSIGNSIINTGIQKLMIRGDNNSTNGPHIQTFTSTDNYPLLQFKSLTHDNISLGFDTYYDGTDYKSSDTGSNFVISKNNDKLEVLYDSGVSQGSNVNLSVATSIDTNGNLSCNGDLKIETETKGFQQKAVAVSMGTADGPFNTGIVLVAGTTTINNSYVTTSCVGFASISSVGGTPGAYFIECGNGTYTITSTSNTDTSTLNVFFIKGF